MIFFKSCFLGSNSVYTAVGDDKQRIMLWAGAQDTVFDDFITDTGATRVPLTMNFRCAPRLVTLLNHLTEHLLGKKILQHLHLSGNPNRENALFGYLRIQMLKCKYCLRMCIIGLL